uniref:Lipocalin n=1 Tax=Rhipicephalus appendiculatus TaxID=34631 RepID=A0A131YPG5_RHIAP
MFPSEVSPCGYAIKYPPGWKVPTLKSFQEMLNTGEKIWMTRRTYDVSRVDCVYWERITLNNTDYDFFNWYRKNPRARDWTKQGPQQKKEQLHAKLCYVGRWPTMKIRHYLEKESQAMPHRLLFWSSKEKCFILELPTGDCELHTWQSMTWKTDVCYRVFFALCGAYNYPVFKKSCIDPKAICVGFRSQC